SGMRAVSDSCVFMYFFFFQAEDGIRYFHVTGVQTCAFRSLFGIPVSVNTQLLLIAAITAIATMSVFLGLDRGVKRLSELNIILRSEERRVGKECRSRWSADR